jgi:hypothetical protein
VGAQEAVEGGVVEGGAPGGSRGRRGERARRRAGGEREAGGGGQGERAGDAHVTTSVWNGGRRGASHPAT